MEVREPAETPSAGSRFGLWSGAALALLVVILFSLSYFGGRTGPARARTDTAQLSLENLLRARQVFLGLHPRRGEGAVTEAQRERLIEGHMQAARVDSSPDALRRLALIQAMVGDERWRETILRLATAPVSTSSAALAREISLWGTALGSRPNSEQIAELKRAIRKMDLGWYSHIALETAYRRAGLDGEAREEARLANRTSARVFLLGLVGTMAGLIGLGICLFLGARYITSARQYRPPLTFVDRLLTPRAPWPFIPSQRAVLYYMFLSYLASFALLRVAVGLLGGGPILAQAARSGPIQAILLALAGSLLPLLAPLIVYVKLGRKAFISLPALGFCTASWRVDVLIGIAGYLASIPLLFAARIVSERLFQGMDTPVNPAISAFAGSENPILQALIFLQAALLAPLIEETLFRGVFFQSLEARMGRWAAAATASAVFAILHPQLPLGFLGIFVLGMVFNSLFILRRSLLPAVVAHAVNNGLILFFLLTLIRS